jgi:hypothetical protein
MIEIVLKSVEYFESHKKAVFHVLKDKEFYLQVVKDLQHHIDEVGFIEELKKDFIGAVQEVEKNDLPIDEPINDPNVDTTTESN